jgi:hypothetical protein
VGRCREVIGHQPAGSLRARAGATAKALSVLAAGTAPPVVHGRLCVEGMATTLATAVEVTIAVGPVSELAAAIACEVLEWVTRPPWRSGWLASWLTTCSSSRF